MFSPDPAKAQEPVFLGPGHSLVLHTKPFTPPPGRIPDNVNRRTVLQARAVRFRTSGPEVKISLNYDPHAKRPEKYFMAKEGEYPLGGNIDSICFTAPDRTTAVVYLEIG